MMVLQGKLARLLLVLTLASAACSGGNGDEEKAEAPRAVRVVQVDEESVSRPIEAAGTLGPRDEIALSFKVSGVIAEVNVDEGSTVASGDVLASLDLREIDAAVTRARVAAQDAERDLERARRLYADSVYTLSQYEDAEARWETARAELTSVEVNRRYAEIVAPADGVILDRRAEGSETVAPGQTVVVMGSRARGSVVRVGLADRDVVRVRAGDMATVQFDALGDSAFRGTVATIAAAANPATGTYLVEIALPAAERWAAGLVGRVVIEPRNGAAFRTVPIEAVLEADASTGTVFVLSGDGTSAEQRQVQIAFLAGDRVAIASGLAGTESVITDGAPYLRDGERVRVVQ
jgi:RND family efflux transporter MFP subunit